MEFGRFNPRETHKIDSSPDNVAPKDLWHREVDKAVSEYKASGSGVTVIFMDVNHFKDINDTLGHAVGDEVIAGIRKVITNNFRNSSQSDRDNDYVFSRQTKSPRLRDREGVEHILAGHLGGDEFGILCKTDDAGARKIADRLRVSFESYLNSHNDIGGLDIGVAIGVSVLQPGMTAKELLSMADYEMFEDKIRQLEPLPDELLDEILELSERLDRYNARLRDIGKYAIVAARRNERLAE